MRDIGVSSHLIVARENKRCNDCKNEIKSAVEVSPVDRKRVLSVIASEIQHRKKSVGKGRLSDGCWRVPHQVIKGSCWIKYESGISKCIGGASIPRLVNLCLRSIAILRNICEDECCNWNKYARLGDPPPDPVVNSSVVVHGSVDQPKQKSDAVTNHLCP